jgi:hypothetical protein
VIPALLLAIFPSPRAGGAARRRPPPTGSHRGEEREAEAGQQQGQEPQVVRDVAAPGAAHGHARSVAHAQDRERRRPQPQPTARGPTGQHAHQAARQDGGDHHLGDRRALNGSSKVTTPSGTATPRWTAEATARVRTASAREPTMTTATGCGGPEHHPAHPSPSAPQGHGRFHEGAPGHAPAAPPGRHRPPMRPAPAPGRGRPPAPGGRPPSRRRRRAPGPPAPAAGSG